MNICFIVCWFGRLPGYFPVWIKSCSYNTGFDYLLFTDADIDTVLPQNIKVIKFEKNELQNRINTVVFGKASLKYAYRVCDFRPMYGALFAKELHEYDYWGYCDIDVVFGKINTFLNRNDFQKDAIFNGGHFTLIKNINRMNNLYKEKGSLFDYKTVAQKEAIFAFDETTGIQRIAKCNYIDARYGIPYIETESKYTQLRSRMDVINPDKQLFYWEKGILYRAKIENGERHYQEIAYIHLQKRELMILDEGVITSDSFWITPHGFVSKFYLGKPHFEDFDKYNPDDGVEVREKEEKAYKKSKIKTILKRTPFQIYVRIKQQLAGINSGDGSRKELPWIKY